MWRLLALLLAVLTSLADARAPLPPAGAIRGRVEMLRPERAPDRRPDETSVGTAGRRPMAERRQALVFLETAPQPAFDDQPPVRARMDQRNETFVPHLLAIPVGATVDFPNDNRVFHNVFSLSRPRPFDLGRYPQGQSRSVRFDAPGVVRVFCEIHSHMSAFIVVFSHRYFSLTDADGRFRIDRVPPGTYAVAAWYEGETVETRQVTVGPDGTAPDLVFTLR